MVTGNGWERRLTDFGLRECVFSEQRELEKDFRLIFSKCFWKISMEGAVGRQELVPVFHSNTKIDDPVLPNINVS